MTQNLLLCGGEPTAGLLSTGQEQKDVAEMIPIGGKVHNLALHGTQEVLGCLCLSVGCSELTTAALEESQ